MTRKEYYETITQENSTLIIIDHQIGLYTGVRDIPTDELKHNIVGLVKAIKVFGIPIIVTTTTESMWGPMIPELRELLKEIPIIERTTVNANFSSLTRFRFYNFLIFLMIALSSPVGFISSISANPFFNVLISWDELSISLTLST